MAFGVTPTALRTHRSELLASAVGAVMPAKTALSHGATGGSLRRRRGQRFGAP